MENAPHRQLGPDLLLLLLPLKGRTQNAKPGEQWVIAGSIRCNEEHGPLLWKAISYQLSAPALISAFFFFKGPLVESPRQTLDN